MHVTEEQITPRQWNVTDTGPLGKASCPRLVFSSTLASVLGMKACRLSVNFCFGKNPSCRRLEQVLHLGASGLRHHAVKVEGR